MNKYQIPIEPQMATCCTKVKYRTESAICRFTTQTTQVYMVAPSMSFPAVFPFSSKAWRPIAFVQKKKIIMALTNPLSIQLRIRRHLNRSFCTPSWYKIGNCKIKQKYHDFHCYSSDETKWVYFTLYVFGFWFCLDKCDFSENVNVWSCIIKLIVIKPQFYYDLLKKIVMENYLSLQKFYVKQQIFLIWLQL